MLICTATHCAELGVHYVPTRKMLPLGVNETEKNTFCKRNARPSMESKIGIYQALWHSFFGLRVTIDQALNQPQTQGLTFEDAILLSQVALRGEVSLRDIARNNERDLGSVSRQTTRLESRGWIVKRRSLDDARLCLLSLTPNAEAALPVINETIDRVIEQCISDLTTNDRQELVRMLFVVNAKISLLRHPAAASQDPEKAQ